MSSPSSNPSPSPHHHHSYSLQSPDPVHEKQLEQRWASVKSRLYLILENMQRNSVRARPSDWVMIYSEFAWLYNKDEAINRHMYSLLRTFINELVDAQLTDLLQLDGTVLLSEYLRRWKTIYSFTLFIKRVSHHLHRYWVQYNANNVKHDPIRPIDNLLKFYWREDVLTHLHSIVDVALALVDDDRRGLSVDRSLITGLVDNLVSIGSADIVSPSESSVSAHSSSRHSLCHPMLNLYHQLFEEPFIAATLKFYKTDGNVRIDQKNVSAFMNSILSQLHDEEKRAKDLLHPDSVSRVRQAAQEQLIGNQLEYLQAEVSRMIEQGRHDDLHVVYSLLKRVDDGLMPVRAFFIRHIRAEGNSVVVRHVSNLSGREPVRHNLILIEVLVQLYLKHASMVRRCFEESNLLLLAIDVAFRGFLNRSMGVISLPNLLAHYVDFVLRSKWSPTVLMPTDEIRTISGYEGDTKLSEKENNSTDHEEPKPDHQADEERSEGRYMAELVRLFVFFDDKDVFCETYRRLLSHRLLTSFDEASEMQFIMQLESQVGGVYTHRFRGMLQDVKTSEFLMPKFSQFLEDRRAKLLCTDKSDKVRNIVEAVETSCVGSTKEETEEATQEQLNDLASIRSCDGQQRGSRMAMATRSARRRHAEAKANEAKAETVIVEDSNVQTDEEATGDGAMNGNDAVGKELESMSSQIVLQALDLELSVHVLNRLHWPSEKSEEIRVPEVMRACRALFTEFYMQDRACRKLTWEDTMSTVTMSARLKKREHLVTASAVQACILLLFNDHDELTLSEISEHLGLSLGAVTRQLRPLLFARRSRLLRRVEATKSWSAPILRKRKRSEEDQLAAEQGRTSIGENDEDQESEMEIEEEPCGLGGENCAAGKYQMRLAVNDEFDDTRICVTVPTPSVQTAIVEASKSRKNAVVDRNTQVDAAIVRIMKTKREVSHVELCAEVIRLLSSLFILDARTVKSRIERLIDMEYMIRDETDTRIYRYCV